MYDVLRRMLELNPVKRVAAADALKMPFFASPEINGTTQPMEL
jgi:hypothetical protein